MNSIQLILIASHLPIAAAVIYAAVVFRQLPKELKVFSVFLFLSGLIQFVSLAIALSSHNNLFLLHFYVPLGFICLAWFYKHILSGFVDARMVVIMILSFILFSFLNTLLYQPLNTFNSYALTAQSVLLIILSISTYLFLLNNAIKISQAKIACLNWINSGIFIYYTSNLLLFYFGEKILAVSFPQDYSLYSWVTHAIFSVIMYICFFIGLWKRWRI